MNSIKLRRHESFSLREGWLEKGINSVNEFGNKTFGNVYGTKILGIGSNMVKSLKYWMIAGGVILPGSKCELTDFGRALLKYDKYLANDFSWSMFHYFLSSNFDEAPVYYYIVNKYSSKYLEKDTIVSVISDFLTDNEYKFNPKSLQEDVNMYFKTYVPDNNSNPEDNFVSPLSKLNLLEESNDRNVYYKSMVDLDKLNYLAVYYAIQSLFTESFIIDDLYRMEKSPVKVFNLEKGVIDQYLNIMKQKKLITVNKTAGLNTIYLNKSFSIEELFNMYFAEEN